MPPTPDDGGALFDALAPGPVPQDGAESVRRGRGPAPRLPAQVWEALLACEETADAYEASTYRRDQDKCWPWLSALSDSGHGKLKAGRAGGGAAAGRTVTAHVYGYQRAFGLIMPTEDNPDPVVAHRCDEPSCQNPAHWQLTTRAENLRDYHRRKNQWPLCDVRIRAGRRSGRAEALREAVRAALAARAQADRVRGTGLEVPEELEAAADAEAALERASEAGRPPGHYETPALF